MFVNAVVTLALFASAVSAQTNASYIDPTQVDAGLKASWCNGQENVCLTLCSKSVNQNTCNPTTLNYSCLCSSNNSSPDLTDYMNSMPYFICEKSYDLCIADHPNDQAAQDNCTTNIRDQCGTLDIANFTAPATSSSAAQTGAGATASPSSAGGASGTASGTSASASATKSSAAVAAMSFGKEYGSSIIAAVFIAAFGFMV